MIEGSKAQCLMEMKGRLDNDLKTKRCIAIEREVSLLILLQDKDFNFKHLESMNKENHRWRQFGNESQCYNMSLAGYQHMAVKQHED